VLFRSPCALLTDGTAESELWQPPVGDYTIVAAYGGTDKYKASTSEATGFTVDPMPTRVTLSNPVMGSVYGTITTFVAEDLHEWFRGPWHGHP